MVLAYIICSGGEIGRHAGLKILWPVMDVRVRFPSGALIKVILIFMFNSYKSQRQKYYFYK